MAKERLQKILASAGIDSRRKCEELILNGLVSVNGKTVDTLPAFADIESDHIAVNGRKLKPPERVYYLLNKPKGYLCTNYDQMGRKRAIDLVPASGRVFCVGRLDADTSGAIIITNDTSLADKLTHPRHNLPKTYEVGIKGKISSEAVEKLKSGVWLSDGRTAPAKVKILSSGHKESFIEIKISQSLNRQIRRVMARVGYKVSSLKRTQIGKLSLYRLGIGKYRPLTRPEIEYLKNVK